jgi:hypothetical protein
MRAGGAFLYSSAGHRLCLRVLAGGEPKTDPVLGGRGSGAEYGMTTCQHAPHFAGAHGVFPAGR